MEKRASVFGIASTIVGLLNLIACLFFLFPSSPLVAKIILVWVPVVGILLGILGFFHTGGRRAVSIVGVLLNLIPIGFVLLLVAVFKNSSGSSGFGGWR